MRETCTKRPCLLIFIVPRGLIPWFCIILAKLPLTQTINNEHIPAPQRVKHLHIGHCTIFPPVSSSYQNISFTHRILYQLIELTWNLLSTFMLSKDLNLQISPPTAETVSLRHWETEKWDFTWYTEPVFSERMSDLFCFLVIKPCPVCVYE